MCISQVRLFKTLPSFFTRVRDVRIRTFVVEGVRLQREHGADGDDIEGQREVGHVELGQKVSEGAAQVDAETRIIGSHFTFGKRRSFPIFLFLPIIRNHA